MLKFGEAVKLIDKIHCLTKTEKIDFKCSQGRILAQDVYSDIDIPPFSKSAMDGYVFKRTGCGVRGTENERKLRITPRRGPFGELRIIEEIPAGYVPRKKIGKGECAKIMTGAIIPQGANCVVKIENTVLKNGFVKILRLDDRDNILKKGEDIKKGQVVLRKGTLVRPQEIAMLATVGFTKIKVYKRPRVGIISTGTELVEVGAKIKDSQIRDSNGAMLTSLVDNIGVLAKFYGIVKDEPKKLDSIIKKAYKECDVVMLSGGVSMGAFDFIPEILKKNKIKLLFTKVRIQPGKPTVFGRRGDKFFFGLPGNPVSSFVTFELFVRPFLYKLMGHKYNPVFNLKKMISPVRRNHVERLLFHPVKFVGKDGAVPVNYHGSGHMHSLCLSDALVEVPVGIKEIRKGTIVNARLI